jgi:hypothetical protein
MKEDLEVVILLINNKAAITIDTARIRNMAILFFDFGLLKISTSHNIYELIPEKYSLIKQNVIRIML